MLTHFYRLKKDSPAHQKVQKYLNDHPKWDNIMKGITKVLGEPIEEIGTTPDRLVLNVRKLKDKDTRSLFKNDGEIKRNSIRAKQIAKEYEALIHANELENFKDINRIMFEHNLSRTFGQELERFYGDEDLIYFGASFDLLKNNKNDIEPISEVDFMRMKVIMAERKAKADEEAEQYQP